MKRKKPADRQDLPDRDHVSLAGADSSHQDGPVASSKREILDHGVPPDLCVALTEAAHAHVQCYMQDIEEFLVKDSSYGNAAIQTWPVVIADAYPSLRNIDLSHQLQSLCARAHMLRGSPDSGSKRWQSVEVWSGMGAVTEANIQRGARAVQFDWKIHPSHNILEPEGKHLTIEACLNGDVGCLYWLGVTCSLFVGLSKSVHRRAASNNYLGNTDRLCVQRANEQMVVASLLFFLADLLKEQPILEQPLNSVLPRVPPLSTVLEVRKAIKTITYLGKFGGDCLKPLQCWHTAACFSNLRRKRPCLSNAGKPFVKLARHGRSADGIVQYTGISAKLKASQVYPPEFGHAVARCAAIGQFILQV